VAGGVDVVTPDLGGRRSCCQAHCSQAMVDQCFLKARSSRIKHVRFVPAFGVREALTRSFASAGPKGRDKTHAIRKALRSPRGLAQPRGLNSAANGSFLVPRRV
jgi:hypothetical protein